MSYETSQFRKYSLLSGKMSDIESEHFWQLERDERDAIITLHRYAATLHRIAENDCNGHPKPVIEWREGKQYRYDVEDEAWRLRDEKKAASLEKKAIAIANQFGWDIEIQGDPRGAVVKLKINGWDATNMIFA